MSKKLIIILSSIAAAVVAAVATIVIVVLANQNKGGYRNIRVTSVMGNVTLEDKDNETYDVAIGDNLYDGYTVTVGTSSSLAVRFDEDKYVYLSADSLIHVKSEGNGSSYRTNIFVEKGTILAELQSPLTEEEEFYLSTSNSVMAVRGTTFGLTVETTETDIVATYCVFKGSTELYVFDTKSGEMVSGKLTDLNNSKLELTVPKKEAISFDEMEEIIETWMEPYEEKFSNPEDANDKLNEVEITVTKPTEEDYKKVEEKIQSEVEYKTIPYTCEDYEGEYDGDFHTISVSSSLNDVKITYASEKNGPYLSEPIEFKDPGEHKVYYRIETTNQNDKYASVSTYGYVKIAKVKLEVDTSDLVLKDGYDGQSFSEYLKNNEIGNGIILTGLDGEMIEGATFVPVNENEVLSKEKGKYQVKIVLPSNIADMYEEETISLSIQVSEVYFSLSSPFVNTHGDIYATEVSSLGDYLRSETVVSLDNLEANVEIGGEYCETSSKKCYLNDVEVNTLTLTEERNAYRLVLEIETNRGTVRKEIQMIINDNRAYPIWGILSDSLTDGGNGYYTTGGDNDWVMTQADMCKAIGAKITDADEKNAYSYANKTLTSNIYLSYTDSEGQLQKYTLDPTNTTDTVTIPAGVMLLVNISFDGDQYMHSSSHYYNIYIGSDLTDNLTFYPASLTGEVALGESFTPSIISNEMITLYYLVNGNYQKEIPSYTLSDGVICERKTLEVKAVHKESGVIIYKLFEFTLHRPELVLNQTSYTIANLDSLSIEDLNAFIEYTVANQSWYDSLGASVTGYPNVLEITYNREESDIYATVIVTKEGYYTTSISITLINQTVTTINKPTDVSVFEGTTVTATGVSIDDQEGPTYYFTDVNGSANETAPSFNDVGTYIVYSYCFLNETCYVFASQKITIKEDNRVNVSVTSINNYEYDDNGNIFYLVTIPNKEAISASDIASQLYFYDDNGLRYGNVYYKINDSYCDSTDGTITPSDGLVSLTLVFEGNDQVLPFELTIDVQFTKVENALTLDMPSDYYIDDYYIDFFAFNTLDDYISNINERVNVMAGEDELSQGEYTMTIWYTYYGPDGQVRTITADESLEVGANLEITISYYASGYASVTHKYLVTLTAPD